MESANIAELILPRIDIIEMNTLADEQMGQARNADNLQPRPDAANILTLKNRPAGFAEIGSGRFNRAAAAVDAVHENGAVPAPFLNVAHEVRVFHGACVEDGGHILKDRKSVV